DKQPVEDGREVPMPILRQCIEELICETPADLLSRELWCSCPSCNEIFCLMING
ncbi:unnamed protein product, partial [Rotaria magnacalcarata]